MTPEEQPFTPQDVDDQIDRFSHALHSPQAGGPALPEQQIVDDLHDLYSAEAEELSQALARGRARLAQNARVPQRQSQASDHPSFLQERRSTMQSLLRPPSQGQKRFYRIGSLAAAVLLVALVGSLIAGLVLVRLGKTTTQIQAQPSFKGGLEIVFQASCDIPSKHCTQNQLALLSGVSATLKGRIEDGLNVSQPVVHQQGSDQIVVDLPPQVTTQDALALLTPIGKLEIIDTGPIALSVGAIVQPGQYPVRFTGDQLDFNSIQAIINQQTGRPSITFQFKSQYQSTFANYTQQNIDNFLTITIDGKVIESAIIRSQITGQVEIAGGGYTLADVKETAALIRYGSLPVPLTIVSKATITT